MGFNLCFLGLCRLTGRVRRMGFNMLLTCLSLITVASPSCAENILADESRPLLGGTPGSLVVILSCLREANNTHKDAYSRRFPSPDAAPFSEPRNAGAEAAALVWGSKGAYGDSVSIWREARGNEAYCLRTRAVASARECTCIFL